MAKIDFFYLKNKTPDTKQSTFIPASFLGFVGWILAGISATAVGFDFEVKWLVTLTLIFPLLAIIPLVLNYVFKFRYYFLPSLMVLSISLCVAMTLAVLFNLVSLYFIFPLSIWVVVVVLTIFAYYLLWHFNQQKNKPLIRHLIKLTKNDKLGIDNIDPSTYVKPSPEWLSLLGYGLFFIGVLMSGAAFFGNKFNSDNAWTLPLITLAMLAGSLMLYMVSVRWCGYIKPTIEVIKILQAEDELSGNQPD